MGVDQGDTHLILSRPNRSVFCLLCVVHSGTCKNRLGANQKLRTRTLLGLNLRLIGMIEISAESYNKVDPLLLLGTP